MKKENIIIIRQYSNKEHLKRRKVKIDNVVQFNKIELLVVLEGEVQEKILIEKKENLKVSFIENNKVFFDGYSISTDSFKCNLQGLQLELLNLVMIENSVTFNDIRSKLRGEDLDILELEARKKIIDRIKSLLKEINKKINKISKRLSIYREKVIIKNIN